MSQKRRLRRQQHGKKPKPKAKPAAPGKSRTELRRQSSGKRFSKPGSLELWVNLLGWAPERRDRMFLVDCIHDGALWREHTDGGGDGPPYDPKGVVAQFARQCPTLGLKLEPEAANLAVEGWIEAGDAFDVDDPPAKWNFLAGICEQVGLGSPTPAELQLDWEAWISPDHAGAPRTVLMELLAQSEQAAGTLNELIQSDNVAATMSVLRALWAAVAYGDETTFKRVRAWAEEWTPPEGSSGGSHSG